jgi:hypothetical protein
VICLGFVPLPRVLVIGGGRAEAAVQVQEDE